MDDEFEGIELAESTQAFEDCEHELETKIVEEIYFDGRKVKKQITTCKKCSGYYKVKRLKEEKVSEEAIWR